MKNIINMTRPKKFWHFILLGAMLGMILGAAVNISIASGWAGLGGFASEERIDMAGENNSSVVVSRDGAGAPIITGMGPVITTGNANVNANVNTATLSGMINSMSGFPSVTVWFEWGESGVLSNSTVITTAIVAGQVNIDIDTTGIGINSPVSYELVGNADGSNRGGVQTFTITGTDTGNRLLWLLIPLIIAVIIILGTLARAEMSVGIIVGFVVAGIFAYLIAQTLLRLVW